MIILLGQNNLDNVAVDESSATRGTWCRLPKGWDTQRSLRRVMQGEGLSRGAQVKENRPMANYCWQETMGKKPFPCSPLSKQAQSSEKHSIKNHLHLRPPLPFSEQSCCIVHPFLPSALHRFPCNGEAILKTKRETSSARNWRRCHVKCPCQLIATVFFEQHINCNH